MATNQTYIAPILARVMSLRRYDSELLNDVILVENGAMQIRFVVMFWYQNHSSGSTFLQICKWNRARKTDPLIYTAIKMPQELWCLPTSSRSAHCIKKILFPNNVAEIIICNNFKGLRRGGWYILIRFPHQNRAMNEVNIAPFLTSLAPIDSC